MLTDIGLGAVQPCCHVWVLCGTDIRTALKAKDEDYVKLLKRQAADVDTMLLAMGQQLSQMTAAYREELDNVDRTQLQVCFPAKTVTGWCGCRAANLQDGVHRTYRRCQADAARLQQQACANAAIAWSCWTQLGMHTYSAHGDLALPVIALQSLLLPPVLQERAELLASIRKEVGQLLEARATAEASFTDRYLAAVDSFAQNLEELQHADGEEFQVLKIK